MNKLPLAKRAQILHMLVEGNSLRATSRMADVSINTVTKLLVDVGRACAAYQDQNLMHLPCSRVQVDEIWSFCYAKKKNLENAIKPPEGAGDVWTWTSLCAETKIVPAWFVGQRDAESANIFIQDLSKRLVRRVQLTSDGLKLYVEAVEKSFGSEIDYAMLVKIYGDNPSVCTGITQRAIIGSPDFSHTSTSFVERQNLTMRMHMRRFTRLTNGFSKKVENHCHAVALHFMYYNFGRIHKTLRVSPAMAAGVSKHLWSLEEIAQLADQKSN